MTFDNSKMTIQELEFAIVSKDFNKAEQVLIYLTTVYVEDKVELTTAPFNRNLSKQQKNLESYQVIEKLATLITSWFSDWSYTPSKETYAFICLQKSFINNLFTASSYHCTDHILANLGLVNKTDYTPEQLRRLLFVITVETAIEVPWGPLFQHLPDASILAYSGQIRSISVQMSHRAQKNIDQLVVAASSAPIVKTLDPENLSPLISTYFNCSNLAHPEKYEIKKWIVKCIEDFMGNYLTPGIKKRIKNDVPKTPSIDQPKVLIFHEFYHYNHAMYRGHHSRLSALKENFHTVGMGIESQFDKLGQKDFDENIVIEDADKLKLGDIVKKILKVKPDIILYPSVGMTLTIPFIASLKLAPIQIASAGHPASTYFKSIDYYHSVDCGQSAQVMEKILFEKWIGYKKGGTYRVETPFKLSPIGLDKSLTNIVVNGVIQKVSHEVLKVCQEINKRSEVQPVFHFFMAHPKQDIEYFSAQSLLRRFLPNAVIHPFSSYNNYMSILNECDFAIATFPFGGTNSNVDLMRLDKPKLYIIDDSDLSGLTDYNSWYSVGYLSGLCESVQDMIDKAVEWTNSSAALDEERNRMIAADLRQKLYDEKPVNEKEIGLSDKLTELLNTFIPEKQD